MDDTYFRAGFGKMEHAPRGVAIPCLASGEHTLTPSLSSNLQASPPDED